MMIDRCFQYAPIVALNCKKIQSHPNRATNMKLFVDKYKWEGINYQSKIDHWKSFEKKSNNCFQYFSF